MAKTQTIKVDLSSSEFYNIDCKPYEVDLTFDIKDNRIITVNLNPLNNAHCYYTEALIALLHGIKTLGFEPLGVVSYNEWYKENPFSIDIFKDNEYVEEMVYDLMDLLLENYYDCDGKIEFYDEYGVEDFIELYRKDNVHVVIADYPLNRLTFYVIAKPMKN
jgi:hypothetical protein